MAGNKYLANSAGKRIEVAAKQSSVGAGDAGKIIALDSAGLIDISMMPVGVAAETISAVSSENLAAGDFVNWYDNAGAITVRKADASNNTKPANGFVLANVVSPASATIYLISGKNTALSGLTIGVDYWLSTTPGLPTATAPSAAGNIVQELGRAVSATLLPFTKEEYYELA